MKDIANNISYYCYLLASVMTILLGLLYATRKKVMPYHIEALETPWEDIDHKFQYMLKALLNGGGYFGLSTGILMMILLLIPFKEGQLWAGYSIGIVGLLGTLALARIVYGVKNNTKGNPPLQIIVFVNILLLIGLLCFILSIN